MKVYVAASCIRGSRGFRYELHGAWTDSEVAKKEIFDAAKRDHVQLTKCGDMSWKGARAIVTVHTLDVDDDHSEQPTSPDLGTLHTPRSPILALGEAPLGETVDDKPEKCPTCNSHQPKLHPAMQHGGEVQPCRDSWHEPHGSILPVHDARPGTGQAIADILSASDLRDAVVKLRTRIEKTCLWVRDYKGYMGEVDLAQKVLAMLDPDHIYDDGD